MENFIKVVEEMVVITLPRICRLVRGGIFFEIPGRVMGGERNGSDGVDGGVRSAARELLYVMTGNRALGGADDLSPALRDLSTASSQP
ncbi:hypothetical protein [Streptomyces sp. NPDC056061]|uniref:hypothetical protein n=1 Tax=Streptomyces sp. NPDC056061 TaxID=3345700 RepID=UPI0035DA16CC